MAPDAPPKLIGLVAASGSAGGSVGGTDDWSLIFHLAAWRYPGTEVVVAERRCSLTVAKDEVRPLMNLVRPYSIVEVEVEDESSGRNLDLRRIVQIDAHDPELAEVAAELQRPIVMDHPSLGRLEYSRRSKQFDGQVTWQGRVIEIGLSCEHPDESYDAVAVAERLMADQAVWQRRVEEYAIEQLLALKNDSWLSEDENPLSRSEFLDRMSLQAICIDGPDEFTFWHNDGNLFWGHAIQISGSLSRGLDHADIPG